MIRVGIVDLGFMGRMHYRCRKALPGATLTAICEDDPKVPDAIGKPSKGNGVEIGGRNRCQFSRNRCQFILPSGDYMN